MRIILTGGTGLIGMVLCRVLVASGHEVIVLSRSPHTIPPGAHLHAWDGRSAAGWGHLVNGSTAIVHLAGEKPAFRWTHTERDQILESHLDTGKAVVQAIEAALEKPRVLLQASAVSYYGDCGDDFIIEDSPPGDRDSWRAQVCQAWESTTAGLDVRRCVLRMGVVLDMNGGVLPAMILGSRFFGVQSGGAHIWIPWIHNHDVALAIRFLINHDTASGVFNLVAPRPQTDYHLMRAVSEALKHSPLIPIPEPALQLALGEGAAITMESQRVIPHRITDLGYKFRFPDIDDALRHLLS